MMPKRWKLQSDRSGFDLYSEDAALEWTGLVVHRDELDQRHPQEFVRGKVDRMAVPDPRPEAPDVFLDEGGFSEGFSAGFRIDVTPEL